MKMIVSAAIVMVLSASCMTLVYAVDNGLGRTPPMGWRSWNCYHSSISQEKMTTAANAMVNKSRGVSLLEVGYENCGLDDYYQACKTGVQGSFHNASGYPLIDKTKFPDMKAMTDHAHSIGLKMGWYANNCGCNEHQSVASWGPAQTTGRLKFGKGPLTDGLYHYQSEVQATIDFGFDGIKLDGCGEFLNLTVFADLLNKTGKPILIENCHWGHDGPGDWGSGGDLNQGPNEVPAEKWCPFNFFRTSGDIGNSWGRVYGNFQSVIQHQPWDNTSAVRTGPGCWAYPDMLEVGNLPLFVEDRTHFGAWAIASAPLILGHDLASDETNDKIWPIITNKAAIRVSQSFAEGERFHPGGMVRQWTPRSTPSPAPAPPAPSKASFLWAVSDKTAGWTGPTVAGKPGQIKHAASGLCVDAGAGGNQGSTVGIKPCSTTTASQQFVLESNGNLHVAMADGKRCLAVKNWEGPEVVMWGCNNGENEEWSVAAGSVCSKGSKQHQLRCLAVKDTPPGPPSKPGSGGGNLQMWAKPQPAGATAVLIINNMALGTPNITANFTLDEIRFNASTAGAKVFDIWTQSLIGSIPAGATSYETVPFGPHDSVFLLLEPKE